MIIPGLNGAQARGGARGHGPPPVGKQHGFYLVDVGDGEHRPVSLPRDLTQMRRVVPIFVKTDLQRADGYTKALSKAAYLQWLSSVVT